MPRRIFLFSLPILLLAWFFVLGQTAKAADIIWDNTQVRMISSFTVNGWDRLIIKPGTIIKMSAGGKIISYGDIEAIGDANNPIVFTSVKDDSVGGDTNGDGGATAPAMGDWGYFLIQGEGKRVTMDYVKINYAGGSSDKRPTNFISVSNSGEPGIKLKEINITHSSIVNNFSGVSFFGDAIFKISQSNFYNDANCPLPKNWSPTPRCDQLSLSKGSGTKIEAPYVYWGHKDGPTTLDDYYKGIKKGTKAYFNVNFIPFLIEPWPSDLITPAAPDPVIIVPGIMGSWNISGRWQIDPIFHTYDNLMEALIAAGYKENSLGEPKPTLFTFPYDWRVDNNLTADLLKQRIEQVKAITGASKVDLIAHSMGGLVARSYIEGSDYQNDIDQVIFLGTPHQGAVESYLSYEGAYFQGFFGVIKKYLFQTEATFNGFLDLTDYIRAQVPTVEQLLPIYDYLKDKQADNFWQLRAYPLNYPQNNYLENLNSQAKIDLLKQRVKVINIVSDLGQSSTLNYLRVIADPDITDNKWQSGYPENLGQNLDSLEMGNGDDTVPFSSANSLIGVETIQSASADHTNLPTVMQKEVIKTLTNKQPTDYFNSKITATIKRWAFFRVYSPVDFLVTSPNGEKIGKNFASSTEINEIPDAFYSGFNGQAEFVLIPNPLDGEYKVELEGVANGGEYTLANSLIDGDMEISKEFSGSILPEQERNFTINYSAASENPISDLEPIDTVPPVIVINRPLEAEEYLYSDNLVIDYTATDDFSGIASTTIILDGQPIATTTVNLFNYSLGQHNLVIQAVDKAGNQVEAQVNFTIIDNVPPVVIINKPATGAKYLRSDNLIIDYNAMDDFSGLATTAITIDGQAVATTTIDLFDYALGTHNLAVIAIDKAGNQAQAQVNFEIITDIDSTISDIKEIYERGWLKKGLYRALLKNAFKLLKIEAKYFERERELTEKLIKKTGQDSKLNAKQKQKQIEQYNKKLAELKKNRVKAIDHGLNAIVALLKNAKKQDKINQAGYDIILSDINYLRINL